MAESMFRKLLKLYPAHAAGTLQLARLLVDLHFARAGVVETEESEKIVSEICSLYERSVASNKEVRRCFLFIVCMIRSFRLSFYSLLIHLIIIN